MMKLQGMPLKKWLEISNTSWRETKRLPVEKAAQNILAGKYDSQRLLIVVRKPDRLLKLVELGVPIKEINVGNMSQTNETRSITKSINVVDQDIEVLKS